MTHSQDKTRVKSLVPKQPIKHVLTHLNYHSLSTYTPNPLEAKYRQKHEKSKALNNAIGLLDFSTRFLPSQIIGAITSGLSFGDYVVNGSKGTGNILSDLAVDIATPIGVSKISRHKRLLPRNLNAKVFDLVPGLNTHASDVNINATKRMILDYYNSDSYRNHLSQSGVFGKEIDDIIRLKTDNVNNTNILGYYDPRDYRYGYTNINAEGKPFVRINLAIANNPDLVRATVLHELGGHAALNSFSHSEDVLRLIKAKPNIFGDPIYERIRAHNYELLPKIKQSWEAYLNDDMETFAKLASNEDKEFATNVGKEEMKKYLQYISTDQESTSRAIADNIGQWGGLPESWNTQQLLQVFTPESVDRLKKYVIGLIGSNILISHGDPSFNTQKQ